MAKGVRPTVPLSASMKEWTILLHRQATTAAGMQKPLPCVDESMTGEIRLLTEVSRPQLIPQLPSGQRIVLMKQSLIVVARPTPLPMGLAVRTLVWTPQKAGGRRRTQARVVLARRIENIG